MNLLKYNRHWENYRFPCQKRRFIFKELANEINTRQIIEISGLRRTGKTTLLFYENKTRLPSYNIIIINWIEYNIHNQAV